MNSKYYKWCMVPLCKNTSVITPDKVFIYVPNNKIVRSKWLKLARRDPKKVAVNSSIYFCEDHFNLPIDMENYMEYHLMGSVSQVRMRQGCMPSKFACQPGRKTQNSDTPERSYIRKKRRMTLLQECEMEIENFPPNQQCDLDQIASGCSDSNNLEVDRQTFEPQEIPKIIDKSVQVHIVKKYRSKANQTKKNKLICQMTSPLKPYVQSVSTSPFKIKRGGHINPSRPSLLKIDTHSDSDNCYTPSITSTESSPSTKSLLSSDCNELIKEDQKQENIKNLESTLNKITKNPRAYIGIPSSCNFLINLIQKQTQIPYNHVLLCLKKIRLNNSFRELADDFAIDSTYASKIFFKNIPIIASVMRPFIINLDKDMIRSNLPMAFRHKFYNVTCIIDCMEIEVQKSSKALNQALSWSEYKKANTVKYLISSTPNGLVNYVSPGYGGRITDTCLVETCDFKEKLQSGMSVMADRGFKHIEVHLRKLGVQLVRPPSVSSGVKLSKSEAKETKQIASLRIHIERVIRRLREFNMLKPHACLNLSLLKVLDEVLTIACGLINLQDSLIK